MKQHTFTVKWSDEDHEWVATVDTYPSLSYLSESPSLAVACLAVIVVKTDEDLKMEQENET